MKKIDNRDCLRRTVCMSISPTVLQGLDNYAGKMFISRSRAVEKILREKLTEYERTERDGHH